MRHVMARKTREVAEMRDRINRARHRQRRHGADDEGFGFEKIFHGRSPVWLVEHGRMMGAGIGFFFSAGWRIVAVCYRPTCVFSATLLARIKKICQSVTTVTLI
ncbi:MAG: hypothetical protein OXU31_09430, partial [Gammaproteobacteria bacterium]|nr:hypothetical protein [Gammaproteobacteria bacterium]